MTYCDTNLNPSAATRIVSFQVYDGLVESHVGTRQITVTPILQPVLAGIEPAPLDYTEGDPAMAVTAAITVSGFDTTTLIRATIQISGNYQSGEDVLSFTNTGNITGSWNAATGTLTLSGLDTVADYQAAMQSVMYCTGLTPNTATRTVSFQVNDCLAESNVVTRQITVDKGDFPLSDGFETGNFSAWPWQLSNFRHGVELGSREQYRAKRQLCGPIGSHRPGKQQHLECNAHRPGRRTLFLAQVSSATGSGTLIFEIDGVSQLQLSGTTPWQQSFFWVSAGQHTFSWSYEKGAGAASGNDFACLDDVTFAPGTTLTVDGTSSNDQFTFDASGASVVVTLNGETHSFAAGEFTNYVFDGAGGTAHLDRQRPGTN